MPDIQLIQISKNLYSIQYEGEPIDEYHRFLEKCRDLDYLESFIFDNREHLDSEFWKTHGFCSSEWDEVLPRIIDEADELELFLKKCARSNKKSNRTKLEAYFEYLDGKYKYLCELIPVKGYGTFSPPFLRLYAIKLNDTSYIIVYGGIKLADTIQNSPELKDNVFAKIDHTLKYLKLHGILCSKDI